MPIIIDEGEEYYSFEECDVNGDGKMDIMDVTEMASLGQGDKAKWCADHYWTKVEPPAPVDGDAKIGAVGVGVVLLVAVVLLLWWT